MNAIPTPIIDSAGLIRTSIQVSLTHHKLRSMKSDIHLSIFSLIGDVVNSQR